MYRLPDVSLLNPVIDLALEVGGGTGGTVQIYVAERQELHIVAHRGFRAPFLQHFRAVTANDGSACGHALLDRRRILVPDTHEDPGYAPHRAVSDEAGYRAVVSMPLMGNEGVIVGVLSVHFAKPCQPPPDLLTKLDLLAAMAARIIETSRLRSKI